ncbi:hypothetical protein [Niveibacterium sp.]|uniref:hypothetical protein n=1 Tax=Niveibacterium sp. TaxID=2017444 RepID=UPI0035AE371F
MHATTCSHALRRARSSLGLAIFMAGSTVLALQGVALLNTAAAQAPDSRIHTISRPAHGIGKHIGIAT